MPGTAMLAAFSREWVGGDIRGLQEIAEKLYSYLPYVQDLVGRLSVTARSLTDDGPGGWQGKAADAFTEAWSRQVATARALEEYVTATAKAIDSLAVELSQIESELEDEAYLVARDGVHIGADGNVVGYAGFTGLQTALEYRKVFQQAQDEAEQVRNAAAEELNGLYRQVFNPNPHLNGADANTGAALLADLMATPTAHRREIIGQIKKLTGTELNVNEEIAEAERTGKSVGELADQSTQVEEKLQKVQGELAKTGRLENSLSKTLDTRTSDVEGYLQGRAGDGRHVEGNTPKDLQAAADDEPSFLRRALNVGNDIPVVDAVSTAVGVGVGTYYDVKDGQDVGSALGDELISNGLETGTAAVVGAELGGRLGAAGGPVGIVAGTAAGYVVGDLSHDLLNEPWGQDIHDHGVAGGILYGTGHSEFEVGDDVRELGIAGGHEAEHLWDDATGWC